MRRRYLLLGGTGFIGLHLARRLAGSLGSGDELLIVDDHSRGAYDADVEAFLAGNPQVRSLHADLSEPGAFSVLDGSFTDVYLLAAVVGVHNAETRPADVLRTNTVLVLGTLDWMVTSRSQRLFYASTSEAYAGGVNIGVVPIPTTETVPMVIDDITNPRFSYAISKLWGEAAVLYWAEKHGVEAVTGRFHNVYGPRMGAAHVIPELALRMLEGENPLTVRSVDQTRAFCYVDDAVEAMLGLMGTDNAVGETFHIGNDAEEVRIGDLVPLVMEAAGVSCDIRTLPPPPGSVDRRCPDITKLRVLTGFQPNVSLSDGVQTTVCWYRENRANFLDRAQTDATAASGRENQQ